MNIRVGILDPDAGARKALQQALESLGGIAVEVIADRDALARRREELDVFFLDADRPDAIALLEETKRARPDLEVVLVTGTAKMELAIKAVRLGAGDYLAKPVRPEQAALAVDRARRLRRLVDENRRLKEQIQGTGLAGVSAGIKRLDSMIQAARGATAALIIGEAGTEREAVARLLHADGPFVTAPTAEADVLARAKGGTLYIDEIAEVVPSGQERLAKADVRVLAGTSRNLLESVGRGEFRMDLLLKLSAVTLSIPPLRERHEDVPLLVDAILRRRQSEGRRTAKAATQEALDTLQAYDWPGNVRELEQAVERACELGGGEWLERAHLPPAVIQGADAKKKTGSAEITKSLKEMESEVIRSLLSEHKGDTDVVAKILKIDRSTLYRKIKRYGIDLDVVK